jgi:hypothetical protein
MSDTNMILACQTGCRDFPSSNGVSGSHNILDLITLLKIGRLKLRRQHCHPLPILTGPN